MKALALLRLATRVAFLAAVSLPTGVVLAQSGLDQPQPFAAYLNGTFPANAPGSTPAGTWATQNAFPSLSFPEPVRIVEHPRANKLVVVSKTGPIWIFNNSASTTTKQLLLDLTSKTNYPSVGEGGVSGFAFHPDFANPASPNRGYIYVAYRYTPGQSGATSSELAGFNRISRFTVPDGSSVADINSEFVLINQYDRQQWHIGGSMFFGNEGFLYIGCGDEGNAWNRKDSTQRISGGLWSGILRIDVDNDPTRSTPISRQPRDASQINSASDSQVSARPSTWPATFTQGYSIPLDNPFRDTNFVPGQGGEATSLGEFYAIGMRHPWTISQDPVTGHIWYADVGQDQREEIGRVVKGGNHQWGYKEGLDFAGPIAQPSPLIGNSTPPILDYSHTVGTAVIGAGVYRGALFPELQGKYVFSDFTNGQLWAISATENGPIPIRSNTSLPGSVEFIMQLPSGFSAGINAYGMTSDGNILLAKTAGGAAAGGSILKLVRQGVATPQPPARLSQTGAFQNLAALTPASGFIPYSMVVPFWSDNAIKSRWVAIPNDGTHNTAAEKITFTPEGNWNFPLGTVILKHFDMGLDQRNSALRRRLETRFLINGNDGWYGVTYRWNQAGTDATLLYGTELETLQITDSQGVTAPQVWTYPSRTQCMTCHTPSAGGALGPMTRQLNKDQLYPATGRTANQLTTFSTLGIFQTPISATDLPNILTLKAATDTTATLSQRARSYLDSNCAYCHQPGGVRANYDARYTTTLNNSNILYGTLVESLGIPGEAVVIPGDTSRSIMYQRANSAGEGHSMPPLAKFFVDTAGVSTLSSWINSLASNTGNITTTGGNFSDAHQALLFVNKTDVFTNTEPAPIAVSMTDFGFFATKKGNPVTPFIATVSGTDSFTVKAIGSTRSASEYQIGENHFTFSKTGQNTITLAAGETIVTGFMDCLPNGSGWGSSSVIPATTTGGTAEDDVWAILPNPLILANTAYNAATNTPSIVVGQAILATNAGKALLVYPSLRRTYKFAVSYALGVQPAPIVTGISGTNVIVNGSFESGFTGWTSTGNMSIESSAPWSATAGNNLIAFNSSEAVPNGVLSQTFATTVGQSYSLAFDAGVIAYNTNAQTMQVTVSGATTLLSQTITANGLGAGTNLWLPQSFTFLANSTTTTLTFRDLSTVTKSIDLMLDNVRVIDPTGPSNTAPVAVANSYSTPQDTALVVPAAGVLANDTDAQSNPLTAVIDVPPGNGNVILNLNGGFSYTPTPGYTGPDSFTYHANDGSLNSNIVSVDIRVNAVVPGTLVNGSFEQDLSGWTTTGNMEIVSAAPYTTTNGTKLLAFNSGNTTPNGVLSQTFPTTTGQTYTLAFDAGALAYNKNSQTLQVTVVGTGSLLSQTMSFTALGGGASLWVAKSFTFVANSATTTLTFRDLSTTTTTYIDLILDNVRITGAVSVPNTAPVAVADSYSTSQDTALVVPATGVLGNDTDAQSNPLTAVLDVPPGNGNVILNLNGGFSYTPTPGYTGADSFTYHANDGSLNSNIVTVSISVSAAVSTALVNGSFESGFTGWTATGNQLIKSASPYVATDGSKLVAFNGGNTTPNAVLSQAFATTVGQTYTLAFDAGVLSYNTNSQTMRVTVTGSGNLLSQTITIAGLSGGTNRWLPQSFTFVANSATSTLTFKDQSTTTNTLDLMLDNVRVTGTVSVPNTAPVAVADSYSTYQDTALVVPANGVLGNDTDAQSNPLTAAVNATPSHGNVTLNPDGSFTYTPTASYTGADSFTYHANDGSLDSNIVTVSITVNALVPGGLINGSFESAFTGWTTSGNLATQSPGPWSATDGTKLVSFNNGDATPNGVLSQTFATTVGQSYILAFDAGVLSYSTNSQIMQVSVAGSGSLLSQTITIKGLSGGTNLWLPQSFTFTANSAATTLTFRDLSTSTIGLDLMLDNVRISGGVTPPNTAPVAVADSYSTAKDTILVVPASGVLGNDTDAQSNPLTAVIDAPPGNGNVILNLNGGFSYTPTTGYTGPDSFTYHANDGSLDSNIVTVILSVNASVSGGLVNGSFEQDFTGWTSTGNLGIVSSTPYTSTNGSKLVAFNGGDTTPNGVLTQTFPTAAGQTYTLTFDAGVLSYNTNSQKLLVTATGTSSLLSQTITIAGLSGGTNRWLPQSFTFTANSASTTLTFKDQSTTTKVIDLMLDNVRVLGPASLNTAPVAVADSYSTDLNTPLVVPDAGVLANDTDAQSDLLAAVLDVAPSRGSLTLSPNGGFSYTPNVNYTGTDSFTYHANDGRLNSNVVTVGITVNALASATIFNGGFEQDLSFWGSSNVAVVSANAYAGTKALNLKSGYIEQSITALVPGDTYTVYVAYRSQAGVIGLLGDATVSVAGTKIGEIHNGAPTDYVVGSGFEFVPTSTSATLRIQSLETGTVGLLLDAIRLERAPLPLPPVSSSLKNGSFEDQTGLSGDNPHVTGYGLPGWLVIQENVDAIRASAFSGWAAVNGAFVLDLSGHGPGGIAQTVNGLTPGKLYTLAFSYARHRYWDEDPILKAEVYGNGSLLTTLVRDQSQKVPAWATMSLQIPAASNGTITIKFRSISLLTGGSIILDNITLQPSPAVPAAAPPATASIAPQGEPSDGASQATTPQPPSIGSPSLSGAPGSLTISMTAPEDGTYVLERSEDIVTWEQVSERQCKALQLMQFDEPQSQPGTAPAKSQMFYRIGLKAGAQPN